MVLEGILEKPSLYNIANGSESDSSLLDDHVRPRDKPTYRSWFSANRNLLVLSGGLLLSLASNVFLTLKIRTVQESCIDTGRSRFSGLTYDSPVPYEQIWPHNETRDAEVWLHTDASPVVVALTHEYAQEHNLPPSFPFPWDDNKSVYYLKVFHQLHCLKVIRRAFQNFDNGIGNEFEMMEHVWHCLNSIRQDIMCKADDTPMPSVEQPHVIGKDQVMECKNWDKLTEWAAHPDRNGCYRIISDYARPDHILEQYGFCPPDSPHYPTMKAYFEKHGHKPYWEDPAMMAHQFDNPGELR